MIKAVQYMPLILMLSVDSGLLESSTHKSVLSNDNIDDCLYVIEPEYYSVMSRGEGCFEG